MENVFRHQLNEYQVSVSEASTIILNAHENGKGRKRNKKES